MVVIENPGHFGIFPALIPFKSLPKLVSINSIITKNFSPTLWVSKTVTTFGQYDPNLG